jgi:small-conductance mechanosensitive channel
MNWQERIREGTALLDIRLFELGGTPVTAWTLATVLMILLATILIARVVRKAMERMLRGRTALEQGNIAVTSRLAHYLLLIGGALIALDTLGVSLTALFAAGALFAVAIGFAMQNLVANFVSGLILLMERAVKPGDIVELDGQIIEIKRMGIRATIGRTLNEEDLIIPSSNLVQSVVKNFTLRDTLSRLRAQVGVTYDSDMVLVRRVLEQVAEQVPWRSGAHEPVILLSEFGSSSVNFEVSVWIQNPWKRQQYRSMLHEAIWFALKEAGVTIAFPQVDVHFDPPVVESLQALRAAG